MSQTAPTPHGPIDEPPAPLAVTPDQRRAFDEDGFFLVEDALSPTEVDTLLGAVDEHDRRLRRERHLGEEPFQMRNVVALDPAFLPLVDHPRILPLVVDLMGINVQLRTSHADVRPPQSPGLATVPLGDPDSFFPWHSDAPNFGWPRVEGLIPFMEMKVGYYLTDLSETNSGEICVVRGSHLSTQPVKEDGRRPIDPDQIVGVNVRPGTALVWRTQLLHALRPNLSSRARRCLYYGYQQRWMRPSDFDRQPEEVLERCNPVQRQLLGELGTGLRNYAGDDPVVHPVSLYWRPKDEDIPLKAWAEAQRA
jgi:hypothetical protein